LSAFAVAAKSLLDPATRPAAYMCAGKAGVANELRSPAQDLAL